MAVRDLRLWPDPVLTQPCAPVDPADPVVATLIQDLFDTMYAAKGRGLAAPQIGVLQQVFVVDVTWKDGTPDPRAFINPQVTGVQGSAVMDEQCLSIPDLPMPVERPEQMTLRWADTAGTVAETRFNGVLARCILHEFDHLQGKVIFDHQAPQDRAALEAQYAP